MPTKTGALCRRYYYSSLVCSESVLFATLAAARDKEDIRLFGGGFPQRGEHARIYVYVCLLRYYTLMPLNCSLGRLNSLYLIFLLST